MWISFLKRESQIGNADRQSPASGNYGMIIARSNCTFSVRINEVTDY